MFIIQNFLIFVTIILISYFLFLIMFKIYFFKFKSFDLLVIYYFMNI